MKILQQKTLGANGGQKKFRKPKLKTQSGDKITKVTEDRILETLRIFLSKKNIITNH